MKEVQTKANKINFIAILIIIIFLIIIVINCTGWLRKNSDVFVVANGSLSYEELAEGYIIRDEIVLVR